jgi:hypothetical protein
MFTLAILSSFLAICRLPADAPFPAWAQQGCLTALVRTSDELSVVCDEKMIPGQILAEKGWRALKVEGPLDFSLTGVLASLSGVLADSGISLFAISTYDTDYILVKNTRLSDAVGALRAAGHRVNED